MAIKQLKHNFRPEHFEDGSFTLIAGNSNSSEVLQVEKLSYEDAIKFATTNPEPFLLIAIDGNGRWRKVTFTSTEVFPRAKKVRLSWQYGLYEFGKSFIHEDSSNNEGRTFCKILKSHGSFDRLGGK